MNLLMLEQLCHSTTRRDLFVLALLRFDIVKGSLRIASLLLLL